MPAKWPRGLRRRRRDGRLLAGLLLVGLALAAVVFLALRPSGPVQDGTTPTPSLSAVSNPGLLSREQAGQVAVYVGSESRPEMNASSVPPRVTDARQMSLQQAWNELNASGGLPQDQDPNLPVWLVRMDGSWLDGAPRPGNLPTPASYPHMTVVLDGRTGELLFSSNAPGEPQPVPETPTARPTATGEALQAQTALETFLGSLAAGPAVSSFYQRAADLYGGSWAELVAVGGGDVSDHPGLLKDACEQDHYHCLTVNDRPGPGAGSVNLA